MPFSRYQIRNEFSLADPELYKAADKDDPEALLEGVAMAGLVGVLRQLGDLAEFAAEIFHGLHEEVMVTATRGHGLLVRVQQLESDFPAIERAFLSQTGHSAFFSSSGIGWHPNLQTEQNLITKGDLPRFVMDSYEECRGPPRLFLLDKFDIAGAGACLKRYTDPSFYKVEASSFEMRNTEAQRDKVVRKTKKRGSRWKNGETPDVFQPSHVKLHQLLLEERMQNRTSEPARHVRLKKREIKFPFDTETGKGYMESLLSSPPEDKLVHEVPIRARLETHEGSMVNSPSQNGSPFESPTVDKTVSSEEHMNNMPGMMIPELPENESGVNSGIGEEEVEEKHISVDRNHKADDVIANGYKSDDVVSEGENYVDALATMESEIETETTEARANSDSNVEQIQSQFSESPSDDDSGSIKKKMESFSDSESSSTSTDNTPRSVTFASTEIPFRPRISPNTSCVDEGVILEESGSKESGLSEMSSRNSIEENHIDPEAITASTNTIDDPSSSNHQSEMENEDGNSNSTLENSHVEEQSHGPSLEEVDICDADVKPGEERAYSSDVCSLVKAQSTDDFIESKSDLISYSSESETETELNDNKTSSIESESIVANVDDDRNLHILEDKKELMQREPEPESVVSVADDVDRNGERTGITVSKDTALEEKKVESIEYVEKDEDDDDDDGVSTTEVPGDNGSEVIKDSDKSVGKKESLIPPESDSIPSSKKESTESGENKEPIISIPSASYNHSNTQFLDTIPTHENDLENPSANSDENLIVHEKTVENGDIQPDLDFQTDNNVPSFQSTTEAETSSHLDIVTPVSNQAIESESMNNECQKLQDPVSEEPSMADLPQLNSNISLSHEINYPIAPMFPAINMLPHLAPINMDEMPPLPPLPPMQWRMGKLPDSSLMSRPDDGQPTIFPQIVSQHPSLDNHKPEHDHDHEDTVSSNQVLQIESSLHTKESENGVKLEEQIIPQPPFNGVQMQSESVSTSGDDERPNGIRPMKIQRLRTPLIDAVASHDKSKLRKVSERARPQVPEEEEREGVLQLRKVSERARPQIPKEEERDTLLEQIRAKSFNLKPAVQTRPSIQGPSTNLRVAAILEKANAIRQAFAGSDDDEDDDDSWSDS